jgi:O-antigen ligase
MADLYDERLIAFCLGSANLVLKKIIGLEKPNLYLDERDGVRMVKKIEEIVPFLLGIYIFLNPFPHTTAVKEFCYYGAVVLALALWVTGNRALVFKTPLTFPLGLFVVWAFLSVFFALDKSNSLHDFRAHLLKYVVLYLMMVTYYNTRKRLMTLAWIVIGSGVLFSLFGFVWYYFFLDYALDSKFGLHMFSEIPSNLIGVTTVFCVILAVHKACWEVQPVRRVGAAFCVFPLLTVTILTQSKATWIALFVGLVALLFRRKIILMVCLVSISALILNTPLKGQISRGAFQSSFGERMGAALVTLEVLKDYPIIGIGYGMETYSKSLDLTAYHERIPEAYRSEIIYKDPHNMITSVAVRLGIVGLGLFLLAAYKLFKMCWVSAWHEKDEFIRSWGLLGGAGLIAFGIIGVSEPVFSHAHEVVLCTLVSMVSITFSLRNNDGKVNQFLKSPAN